ncbi:hypothetical protein FD25_GL002230 [Levilactobacillus acidifarinae DSM 19394]|uniref:galactosylceramidase n=1 Tax=Levilactobacillus acidifarinae DSM 19394 = JCM 15949 TaxID=1423715 RepID=A0A0R1LPJ6_9LACO|nr:hypothetical protein FD25_GL002230 [Levilactobacillus acidifarinae DSM 19394]
MTIDGDLLETTAQDANTFKGFGYLSCNNSSRLLLDYKWEQPASYQQILQILFGGRHPLMSLLKVELGDDANTSSGTEPAPKRSAEEPANVMRGAGYQLIADAKRLNPRLKTCLLRWGEPGYLRPLWVAVKSIDPDHNVPETAYEPMYQFYKQTIVAAYNQFGYLFDYVDPDRNETKHPMYRWIKWFANRLHTDQEFSTDFPIEQYHQIKIIAADQNYETDFGDAMLSDLDLLNQVAAVGYHYNTDDSPAQAYTQLADQHHREVWYSEGIAPMTSGKYRVRATSGEGIGGKQSGLDVANRLIKSYVRSRRSLYIFQPAVAAYYPGVNYSHKELITANHPWSGYFEVDNVGLQIMRHFTDFARAGWAEDGAWRYLPSACDSGVGGTENLDTHTDAPSYLTLVAPDKRHYSLIMVNDSATPRRYTVTLRHLAAISQPVNIWESRGPEQDYAAYDENLKQYLGQRKVVNGQIEITVPAYAIVTATTLDLVDDLEVRYTRQLAPRTNDLLNLNQNVFYQDSFAYADRYQANRGGTPRYTTDQGGAFEVQVQKGRGVLRQEITEQERALDWEYSYAPNLTFGDDRWRNYTVEITMQFDDRLQQNSPTGNYFGIGLYQVTDVKGRLESAPYVFKLAVDGSCQLIKNDQVVALSYVDGLDVAKSHRLSFGISGNQLTAQVDRQVVFTYIDTENPHYSGRVKLGTGYYHTVITKIVVRKTNHADGIQYQRIDDLDERLTYQGGWQHECGLGNTIWNRTLSTGRAGTNTQFAFSFAGTGFALYGRQTQTSHLKFEVDGKVVSPNFIPQVAADKVENTVMLGLPTGDHRVVVTVMAGVYMLDAVGFYR